MLRALAWRSLGEDGDTLVEMSRAGAGPPRARRILTEDTCRSRFKTLVISLTVVGFAFAYMLWLALRPLLTPGGSDCTVHGVCEVWVWVPAELLRPNPFVLDLNVSFHWSGEEELWWQRWRRRLDEHEAGRTESITTRAFYDGNGAMLARFCPSHSGTWYWSAGLPTLGLTRSGSVRVRTAPSRSSKGQVRASGRGFAYDQDGTPHVSVGTTAYAWIHQNWSLRQQTLQTLARSPFNKLRMTIFPKWYTYNHKEPESGLYPYEGSPPDAWDFTRFNPAFWRSLEESVRGLRDIGVIADIILFHPYDYGHWGFDCMGGRNQSTYDLANDVTYLRYAVARLSSFSNVWWSLANEWDLIACKAEGLPEGVSWDDLKVSGMCTTDSCTLSVWNSLLNGLMEPGEDAKSCGDEITSLMTKGYSELDACRTVADAHDGCYPCHPSFLDDRNNGPWPPVVASSPVWDALAAVLTAEDPYGREASIHHARALYNHSREWVTHVSLQGLEHLTARFIAGRRFGVKPVIWDEVQYEGDLPRPWAQLSGPEMTDRFWWGTTLGAYVGHSEALLQPGYVDDDQLLWWSKGGKLHGRSVSRIQWFAEWASSNTHPPLDSLEPMVARPLCGCDGTAVVAPGEYALWRLERAASERSGWCNVSLPGLPRDATLVAEAIDWWTNTRLPIALQGPNNDTVPVWVGGKAERNPRVIELKRLIA